MISAGDCQPEGYESMKKSPFESWVKSFFGIVTLWLGIKNSLIQSTDSKVVVIFHAMVNANLQSVLWIKKPPIKAVISLFLKTLYVGEYILRDVKLFL